MHLGVDFGTTRTIVAAVDRGNYPVVAFMDDEDDPREYFPSVVAFDSGTLRFGFDALTAARDGAALVRSFKRVLASPGVTPQSPVWFGTESVPVAEVLTGFLAALADALATRSSIAAEMTDGPRGHTVVAVPAHAHGAQRFLTLDAFRSAGFDVTAMINEPSAAGYEYTHRQRRTLSSRRTRVIVYDLGGGTFDASLVAVDDRRHDVVDSLGVNHLGGDDFDAVLAALALEQVGIEPGSLAPGDYATLLDEARSAKERLYPQSKRLVLEVAGTPVMLRVEEFFEAVTPLVETTVAVMEPLVGGLDEGRPDLTDIAGIYLVGGASGLPLVPRVLRHRFGRRVHRSPYPAASTAIGLAIAADDSAGYSLTDRLSRGFGVFREGRGGSQVQFDPILDRRAAIPERDAVVVRRRYLAAHNIGWFRFVEYSSVDSHGEPRGDLMPFGEVVFPFDPALRYLTDLREVSVERRPDGPLIEEEYLIDRHGMVSVRITDLDTGYTQEHSLSDGMASRGQNQGLTASA